MGSNNTKTYFYRDKPLFGLDIGFSTVKAMQIDSNNGKHIVTGFGTSTFNPACIKNGIVVDHENLANSIYQLFSKQIVGEISSRRVAISVPISRTFTRPIKLPSSLNANELDEAVKLEAERYIPLPIDQLYLDYAVSGRGEKEVDILLVAAPRQLIDSYMSLGKILGLDIVAIETTIAAAARLLVEADRSDVPTILIDFGSKSVDITIFDRAIFVTGTVAGGSDDFTSRIAEKLDVKINEAYEIKSNFGLGAGKHQQEIVAALDPILQQLLKEVRRVIRYFEERGNSNRKIGQIITMGGGANVPGLSDYMTNELRLPVRMSNPWGFIKFTHLTPPNEIEKSMYATVAGSAIINPRAIYK